MEMIIPQWWAGLCLVGASKMQTDVVTCPGDRLWSRSFHGSGFWGKSVWWTTQFGTAKALVLPSGICYSIIITWTHWKRLYSVTCSCITHGHNFWIFWISRQIMARAKCSWPGNFWRFTSAPCSQRTRCLLSSLYDIDIVDSAQEDRQPWIAVLLVHQQSFQLFLLPLIVMTISNWSPQNDFSTIFISPPGNRIVKGFKTASSLFQVRRRLNG